MRAQHALSPQTDYTSHNPWSPQTSSVRRTSLLAHHLAMLAARTLQGGDPIPRNTVLAGLPRSAEAGPGYLPSAGKYRPIDSEKFDIWRNSMDYSSIITPKRLTNMQEMEVHVGGPDGANRLFIYSGMAEVELCGGLPHPRWSLEVICFEIGRYYKEENGEKVVNILATASLAGARTDGVASFGGWEIFGAAGELDHESCRVRMNIAAGARDTQAFLEQICFQVNVLAKV
jgi:hypothetical protein